MKNSIKSEWRIVPILGSSSLSPFKYWVVHTCYTGEFSTDSGSICPYCKKDCPESLLLQLKLLNGR